MAKAKAKSRSRRNQASPVDAALAQAKDAKIVDFKFVDLPGIWQHFSIPAQTLEADMFTDGLGL